MNAPAETARERGGEANAGSPPAPDLGRAVLAVVLAWLVPGAGHFLLDRRGRGLTFLFLVLFSLAVGVHLDGRLPWVWSGSPLQTLATLGALGAGLPTLLLRFAFGYQGDITASGYEYGSAFVLTAGLMNLLLLLDAWDIAVGRRE